jgi:asparagine synthase (glutamine-hydrolysing)
MSVQAGIWNFDGRPVDPKLIADLHASLKQLGPDGESCWSGSSIALLYRPFHTSAESRPEKQPHISRRGFVLTWDGRLDNRAELVAEFRAFLGEEPTDIALIAAGFDRWEIDSFGRFIGDWAVSIWKPEQRELIIASDYMATRHVFYYLSKDRIWWSTDLAPLVLLSGETFHIDDDYIAGYFAHDPDANLTPYREIREVPPGHFVRILDGSGRVGRYWKFSPNSRIRYKTDAEYQEHFRHVFRQSVRRRLRCDSPVLAELSGGLDSSSIVCMADDILTKEGSQAPRVDTLSYYDKTEPHGDDWVYFQKVEASRGRCGHHIDASRVGSAPASLQPNEFYAMPGSLGSGRDLEEERAVVMRAGGYRVVLSGIGGDEFLGGIPNPSAQLADLIMQCKPLNLAKQLIAWSLVKRRPWIHLLWDAVVDLLPPSVSQHVAKQAKVESWIDREFAKRTKLAIRLIDVNEHFGLWLPSRRSCAGGVVLMANKLAKWTPSPLQPEETRYPYLDQSLLEFILSIPANQLLRPYERRSLMRRSLVGLVPDDILARQSKQFSARTPVVELEKHVEQIQAAFESPFSSYLGYTDGKRFIENFHAARNGKSIHIVRMFRTISLEFWLRDLVARGLIVDTSALPAHVSAAQMKVPAHVDAVEMKAAG